MREDIERILEDVRACLRQDGNAGGIAALVDDVHPADLADLYPLLDDEEKSRLIFMLPAHATAEVIAHLDDVELGEAVEPLGQGCAARCAA